MCLDHCDLNETLALQSSHWYQLARLLHTESVLCGCTQLCSNSFFKAFFQFIRNVKAWCSGLFILGVLLPYKANGYMWPFIQTPSNKQTLKAHTEAHRHISDSDTVYFPESHHISRVPSVVYAECQWECVRHSDIYSISKVGVWISTTLQSLCFRLAFLRGGSLTFHHCLFLSLQQVTS